MIKSYISSLHKHPGVRSYWSRKGCHHRQVWIGVLGCICVLILLFSGFTLSLLLLPREPVHEPGIIDKDGPSTSRTITVSPDSIPVFIYPPIVSDVTAASFRVSWVTDQPVNASVEYCQYSPGVCDENAFPSSPSLAYDEKEMLPSGASLVKITGLNPGTRYHFRAIAKNASGGVNIFPNAPPYPSVTTKTDTNIQTGNPTFNLAPYNDKNQNSQWDDTIDEKQYNFLLYLNHSGAGTLVSRGSGGSGWVCTIDANNLRTDTPAGPPHPLSPNDVISFFIVGLHDDGTGDAVWSNWTASYIIPDPMISPVDLVKRTEHQIPERLPIAAVILVCILFQLIQYLQRRRFSM